MRNIKCDWRMEGYFCRDGKRMNCLGFFFKNSLLYWPYFYSNSASEFKYFINIQPDVVSGQLG